MNKKGGKNKDFKVVLVGDSYVGKSCLVFRYFQKKFHDSSRATVGTCYNSKMWCHNGELYRMEVWDTSGEEKYRSITSMHYRKAVAAIVCFDLSQSDKECTFENLHYWIVSVLNREPLCKIYLCATKSDLVSAPELFKILEELEKIAEEYKTLTYVTSSKTGGDVDKLFEDIFNDYVVNCKKNLNSSTETDSDLLKLQTGRLRLAGEKKKASCSC